jgi:plasmid stabilization system protein ParE
MSYSVEWSRRAGRDMRALRAYIAVDSPVAAARLATELADSLAEMPNRGRRAAANPAVRELVFGRYGLRYRVAGETVLIVRVKHTAQQR